MIKKMVVCLCISLSFVYYSVAYGAGGVEVKSVSEVEIKEKNAKGETVVKRIEAAKANVGPLDEVIFTNHCVNKGEKPAENVVITNPIPEHTVYVANSAEGDGTKIEFSVDKGKTFGKPEDLKVPGKDGNLRPARPEDYTNIRWTMTKPLAPGRNTKVSFKAKIK